MRHRDKCCYCDYEGRFEVNPMRSDRRGLYRVNHKIPGQVFYGKCPKCKKPVEIHWPAKKEKAKDAAGNTD